MAYPIPMSPMQGGPLGSTRSFSSQQMSLGRSTGPLFPGEQGVINASMRGGPRSGSMRKLGPKDDGLEAAMHSHRGPFHYQHMAQGNCGPEYFSRLWEDELRADLKEDSKGVALDHWRKFGEGHARVGGRINLSLVEAPIELINKEKGAYTDYRMTTSHLDGGDDPLYSIQKYWDPITPEQKHIHLVAGGLEHVHLGAGDLKEEVKHEKEFEKSQGWLHKDHWKLPHSDETVRLHSGAHLPPDGTVLRIVVPKLLKGQQLGLDIPPPGVIVKKVTEQKAKQLGWMKGDQILKVNGRIVSNNLDFQQQMEHAVAVLRDSERPIVFEVWRKIPMAGTSWLEHNENHRFALPQSIFSQQLSPELQAAHLEHENKMLRDRLRQEEAIIPTQAQHLTSGHFPPPSHEIYHAHITNPTQAQQLHPGHFPPPSHEFHNAHASNRMLDKGKGKGKTIPGTSWNSWLQQRDVAPLDRWFSGVGVFGH